MLDTLHDASPATARPPPNPWADLQDFMPDDMALALTYDVGLALGFAAGDGHMPLAGFLTDAMVLSRRHEVAVAARLMDVSVTGLRGFLDGARCHTVLRTDRAAVRIGTPPTAASVASHKNNSQL